MDIHAAGTLACRGSVGLFLPMALSAVPRGSDVQIHKLRLQGYEGSAEYCGDKGEGPPDLDASLSECRDCAALLILAMGLGGQGPHKTFIFCK